MNKYKVTLWNEGLDKNNPKKIVKYSILEKYFSNYDEAFKFKWTELVFKLSFNKGKIEDLK